MCNPQQFSGYVHYHMIILCVLVLCTQVNMMFVLTFQLCPVFHQANFSACPVWIHTQSNITNIMYTIVPLYYVYPSQPCLEKTHDFRQNFDRLFSHEATISEVKGASFEYCVTDTPYSSSTPNSMTVATR